MKNPVQDIISQVKSLMKERKYREALELLEKVKAHESLSVEESLDCKLLESKLRISLGDFENARVLVEKVLQASREQDDMVMAVGSLGLMAQIDWRSGEYGKGLEAVEEGERILEGIEFELGDEKAREAMKKKAFLLGNGGIICWFKGDLERAREYAQRSLEIEELLDDLPGQADSLNNLGLIYWSKGDFEQAIGYYHRSLEIHEKIGDRARISTTLSNIGNVYSAKGELDAALESYQRSLAIKTEMGLKYDIWRPLINIGTVYRYKGQLDLALDHYRKSLALGEELEDKSTIALAANNMGDIHIIRGELGEALECFQRSLELYEELGQKEKVALLLFNTGEVYRKKGNYEEAQDYYVQSLTMYEEMDSAQFASAVLFNLLWVALDTSNSSLAQQYLKKLEQINERWENQRLDQRYRIGKALTLKYSTRARHKLEAVKILEEVIKEEILDHQLTVGAMVHLCDLLLSELKLTGEEELFGEIKELTGQLLAIAQDQSSASLLAETYLLQSKLALIELDMGQARKLLAQAHGIAEEKGLNVLAQVVVKERDALQSQMKKWEALIKQKPSKQEMVDITNIDVMLERMIQKTVVTVMEEQGISGEQMQKRKYKLVYVDRLKERARSEKHTFRVAIAQIGLSKGGDILHEFYEERTPGLFGFREEIVERVRSKLREMVEEAARQGVSLLIFPELTIDLGHPKIIQDINLLAKTYKMLLVPGSYHDHEKKQNLSVVISPDGILWEQVKHIPAMIHFEGTRLTEGIARGTPPRETIICGTEFGRIAIVICRDFLDMDLRVQFKNAEPPVDLVINPAFTPVTADFKAAHFDARRSIYAYCFFANVAEFGDSLIYTPEKERVERSIPAGEEGLIFKEVDLFKLRSERKKWEAEQRKNRPFIQSTR
jgi:tetratricopeptide (TPR) repeat protein/predicted amidohydrolase